MSTFKPDWILESPDSPDRHAVAAFCPECGGCMGAAVPDTWAAGEFGVTWASLGLVVAELHGQQRPRSHGHADGCTRENTKGVKL